MNKYFVTNLNPSGPGSLSEGMRWNSTEKRAIYFEVAGTINFPEDSYLGFYSSRSPYENPAAWSKCRNIEVRGESAPGHVIITGSPVWLLDPVDVRINGLTFLLDAPTKKELANFWGTLRVQSSGPGKSNNLILNNCAFVGGEDEVCLCSTDPWPKPEVTTPYLINCTVENCFLGYGTTKWRGNHNHALAATLVENFIFRNNFIAHENRRCPQVDGTSEITGNIIYNYGTMGIGFYRGIHNVGGNIFIRGPQSRDNPLVNLIQVAESDRVGTCVINTVGNKLIEIQNKGNGLFNFSLSQLTTKLELLPKIEDIDLRNPNIKLIHNKFSFINPSLKALYQAGPIVNGKELSQVIRARNECLTKTGGWVKTLKESNLL